MNLIPQNNEAMTMSSREIAELCDKRHDHVMRDIRVMLVELYGEGGVPSFGDTHRNPQNGQEYPIFQLPKDLTLTLVAGYNVKLRKRIIDRWLELENKVRQPDPMQVLNDPTAMRGLLLTYSEKVIQLEAANAELAPKAAITDLIVTAAEGAMNVTLAAKTLQLQPKALFTWLSAHRWIYRRAGGSSWVAYQDKIQQGLLQHKITTVERSDGSEKVVEQVLITAKGLARLAGAFGPICA